MFDFLRELVAAIFKGINFAIASVALLLIAGCVAWNLASDDEQKKHVVIIWQSFAIAVFACLAMLVAYWVRIYRNRFHGGCIGILVCDFVGDSNSAIRTDLVNGLEAQANKDAGIQVLPWDVEINGSRPSTDYAHRKARRIGRRLNAQLVLWGDRIGDKKFWPRITVINSHGSVTVGGNRQLPVQALDQVQLPELLINEPVYLSFFIKGVFSYNAKAFDEALTAYQSALELGIGKPADNAILRFHIANCRYSLAPNQHDPKHELALAITDYQSAINEFGREKAQRELASAQNNLGSALSKQAELYEKGEALKLIERAIAAYNSALGFRSPKNCRAEWAATQNNLANALVSKADLLQGDEARQALADAIKSLRNTLYVWTPSKNRRNWATAQYNLGNALLAQARLINNSQSEALINEGVGAFRLALAQLNGEAFLWDRATTQDQLCLALIEQAKSKAKGEAERLLVEAVDMCRNALAAYNKEKNREDIGMALNNLGFAFVAHAKISEKNKAVGLLSAAMQEYKSAIEVLSEIGHTEGQKTVEANLEEAENLLSKICITNAIS